MDAGSCTRGVWTMPQQDGGDHLGVVAGCELTGQRVHHPVGVHVEPGRTKQCTATLFRGD